MRRLEALAVSAGVSEYTLMKRAGEAAAEIILHHYGASASRFIILCGGGNNGGDALVAASKLALYAPVIVYAVKDLAELKGAAAFAARDLNSDIKVFVKSSLNESDFECGDVIVDGLLGIGFNGLLRENLLSFVNAANNSKLPIVSLDLPSGINADSGKSAASAINASLTITFERPKRGLFIADGPRCCGKVRIVKIGIPEDGNSCGSNDFNVYTNFDAVNDICRSNFDVHKFSRGAVVAALGSRSYPGAAVLASTAALRSGAGIVTLLTPVGRDLLKSAPSALIVKEAAANSDGAFSAEAAEEIQNLTHCDVIVAGCGWSTKADKDFLAEIISSGKSLVLDADALNILSLHPELWAERKFDRCVITPHTGEAARLAAAFSIEVTKDRISLAQQLAEKLECTVVLKGPQSICASADGTFSVNTSGCTDLATAGSGDVLAGIISAFMASGLSAERSARAGVWIHGLAGEFAGFGVIADDLPFFAASAIAAIRENRKVF
jgi:NAD(P)H-hydrate epimerase